MQASLSAVFCPQAEGGFTVICPELPECVSEGDTYEEALANITSLIKVILNQKNVEDKEIFLKILAASGKIFTEINISVLK